MKLITKYILKELTYFFVLTFFIFSAVFMLRYIYKIINLVVGKGADFFDVIKLFFLSIPAGFQLIIPMSLIISILMALGRLAADSEIIVLRACGIKFKTLIKPILIFSIILAILDFYSVNYLSPQTLYAGRKLLYKISKQNPVLSFEENKSIVIGNKKIRIGKIKDNKIFDVMIIDEDKNTITANSGIIKHEKNNIKLLLEKGYIEKYVSDDYIKYDRSEFGNLVINIPIITKNTDTVLKKENKEMSFFELKKYLNTSKKINNEYYVDLYNKLTIPFACIALSFIAIPIGLSAKKTGKAIGFTWGIVSIFAYYALFAGFNTIAVKSSEPQLIKIIVWIPNFIMLISGIILYRLKMNKI
jgi:LPS export ABC transporter permease LptF